MKKLTILSNLLITLLFLGVCHGQIDINYNLETGDHIGKFFLRGAASYSQNWIFLAPPGRVGVAFFPATVRFQRYSGFSVSISFHLTEVPFSTGTFILTPELDRDNETEYLSNNHLTVTLKRGDFGAVGDVQICNCPNPVACACYREEIPLPPRPVNPTLLILYLYIDYDPFNQRIEIRQSQTGVKPVGSDANFTADMSYLWLSQQPFYFGFVGSSKPESPAGQRLIGTLTAKSLHFCPDIETGGEPFLPSGQMIIELCGPNQVGQRTKLCDLGVLLVDSGKCVSCPPNSFSMNGALIVEGCQCFGGFTRINFLPGFLQCVPGLRITDITPYSPKAIFFFDNNAVDSTGNFNSISIGNYMYTTFYNRDNLNNRALSLNGGQGLVLRNITLDSTFSITMIVNSKSLNFDLIKIVDASNNAEVITVRVLSSSKVRYLANNGKVAFGTTRPVFRNGISYFFTVSYRNGLFSNYLDDMSLGKFTRAIPQGTYTLIFGQRLNGFIDELSVFDSNIFNFDIPNFIQRTRCTLTCPSGQKCFNTASSTPICA